jgi:Gas vesicle synthesis protein GvpO
VAENGAGDSVGLVGVVRAALEQFTALTQMEPVAATGVRREEHGWSVLVDVVELERVPSTTSVMATYRVDVDGSGELSGYERLRRFNRGSVDA